jgi:hypothetical protein
MLRALRRNDTLIRTRVAIQPHNRAAAR